MIYAGIGSRETPKEVLITMWSIANQLAHSGWLLRSGRADGADLAFEQGCIEGLGKKEIFIPWFGFNHAPRNDPDYIRRPATVMLAEYAAQFHPAWDQCSDAAKLLHMRNVCQILGAEGTEPVDMVICWTKNGKRGGGTGQALRIAEHHNIPIFDLALANTPSSLCLFVSSMEKG